MVAGSVRVRGVQGGARGGERVPFAVVSQPPWEVGRPAARGFRGMALVVESQKRVTAALLCCDQLRVWQWCQTCAC